MALIVRQTAEAFKYPAGTEWGPYEHLGNALERKAMLQKRGSDGKIIYSPKAPCAERRPKGEA